VIVLTTSSDMMDIQLSYELGANSFLTKPFDLAEFREMVKAFHLYWIIHAKPSPQAGRVIPNPGEAV
jgi:two-component system, response regulator